MTKKETERVNEWSKTNTKGYYFKLNIEKDADLISWLETISNKQGYFKSLISADMERQTEFKVFGEDSIYY